MAGELSSPEVSGNVIEELFVQAETSAHSPPTGNNPADADVAVIPKVVTHCQNSPLEASGADRNVEDRPSTSNGVEHSESVAVLEESAREPSPGSRTSPQEDDESTPSPLAQIGISACNHEEKHQPMKPIDKESSTVELPSLPQWHQAEQSQTADQFASSLASDAVQRPTGDEATTTITSQIVPAMIPDLDFSDEAYPESTSTSYVTSIASAVSRGVVENERLYPSYGQHSYGMPIDEDEKDRMDLQHRKYELLLGGRHFLAPLGPSPQRILDLCTGTGIWALDIADAYPSAQVIGVDIAPIQPRWVSVNCQFEIDDVESTWTFKQDSFDFIHFRDPLYTVRDWPKLVAQCYNHLKPGGWCEFACIYPVVMCDDGTMPADSGFKVICERFMEASTIFGTPVDCPLRFARYLQEAGFVDVSENIFKIPSSPWPKDKRLKKIGAMEMTNVCEGSSAFALRAFEKAYGWSREQTEIAMVGFRRDVRNRKYHQYCQ